MTIPSKKMCERTVGDGPLCAAPRRDRWLAYVEGAEKQMVDRDFDLGDLDGRISLPLHLHVCRWHRWGSQVPAREGVVGYDSI